MSSNHLGRNPFEKKKRSLNQSRDSTLEKAQQCDSSSESPSLVQRICIELPAKSFVFALRTALEIKKILER